jgi:hypothetical protein
VTLSEPKSLLFSHVDDSRLDAGNTNVAVACESES